MKIILASNSLRRQELLKMINIPYEVMVSNKEEFIDNKLLPIDNCINISLNKAMEIKEKTNYDRIIISCDTIVSFNNEIIGKPHDKQMAFNMLKKLSGSAHEVISALTVIIVQNNHEKIIQEQGICKVYLDNLSDDEINLWIDNHKPYDKAGAYAIQEEFGKHINKIEGDYYSIVGLPLNKLYNILKEYL